MVINAGNEKENGLKAVSYFYDLSAADRGNAYVSPIIFF